jgi:hypothetical protein
MFIIASTCDVDRVRLVDGVFAYGVADRGSIPIHVSFLNHHDCNGSGALKI